MVLVSPCKPINRNDSAESKRSPLISVMLILRRTMEKFDSSSRYIAWEDKNIAMLFFHLNQDDKHLPSMIQSFRYCSGTCQAPQDAFSLADRHMRG